MRRTSDRISLRARWWLGGMAAAGLVAAHSLAYRTVAPHHGHRDDLLTATGHRWWPFIAAVALGVFVASVTGFVARRYLRREDALRTGDAIRLAGRLAVIQVPGFVLLEAAERSVLGSGLSGLAAEPVLWVGIGAQLVVAWIGGILLSLTGRAVDAVRRLAGDIPAVVASTAAPLLALLVVRAPAAPATGGATLRGPPPAG